MMPRLSDLERHEVMRYLEADEPLPQKYRFLLFEDKRQVELVCNGKTNTVCTVCNVVPPFQTIEVKPQAYLFPTRSVFNRIVKANSDISNYYPDFITKPRSGIVAIGETKGLVDVDVPHKMQRLGQWISNLNAPQTDVIYDFTFVDEDGFLKHRPKPFGQLLQGFTQYKTVKT